MIMNKYACIVCVKNIRNTFLIFSYTSFSPQNSLNSSRHGLYKVSSFPQGCWAMLTPVLPKVVSSWLDVLWVVDHSWYTGETVEHEKSQQCCSSSHTNQWAWHLLPYPIQKAQIFCLAHSPSEWHTYTFHVSIVSRLKNTSLTCLHTIIYPDLKWI